MLEHLPFTSLAMPLQEMIDAGHTQPSTTPYGAPVLFQRKHDGTLRMCVDHRARNKVIVKKHYPISLIADLFGQLESAKYFTKLDLRKGYYQKCIADDDEQKTTCVTRYVAFEF